MSDKPKIHTHASGEEGLAVNAYLVETENGVVAVDATLTVSEARAFRAEREALNKPLLAVLLTHPHSDHVAGLTELVGSPEVPILALPSIDKVMRETEDEKHAQWGPVFGDEWITRWTYPNRFVEDREAVEFDGVTYRVHDLGPGGDSDANSIWSTENRGPRVAFTGDIAFNGTHSYIADGHVLAWLANLENTRALLADVEKIYPGHGAEASLDLLEAQKAYLLTYCAAVKELSDGEPALTETAGEELERRMEEYLPEAAEVHDRPQRGRGSRRTRRAGQGLAEHGSANRGQVYIGEGRSADCAGAVHRSEHIGGRRVVGGGCAPFGGG